MDVAQRVPCTISVGASQDITGQRRFKPADLLASFVEVRSRIEAIALGKFRRRAKGATGLVHLWSDDIDDAHAASAINFRETGCGQGSEAEEPRSKKAEGGKEGCSGPDLAPHARTAEAHDTAASQLTQRWRQADEGGAVASGPHGTLECGSSCPRGSNHGSA